jgi:hypothetical protein
VSSGNSPPPEYSYAGWVPTVAGRLSFRHIGESDHPTESVYANVAAANARFIVAYQRRNLSDSLFKGVMDLLSRNTGQFWFVMTATSPKAAADGDEIFGTIYIYKSKRDWASKIKNLMQATMHRLHILQVFPAELDARGAIDVRVSSQYDQISAAVAATADIAVKFKLVRDGSSYFSRPSFADPALEAASTAFAHESGLGFPKWISDQAYFFLRDMCHTHQHHTHEDDTILMLRPYDAKDVRWRRDIIYSLYYYIIRAKRTDEFNLLYRALGVLAYCRSFKIISSSSFREAGLPIGKFNDAALKQSIEAKIAEDNWNLQRRETKAIQRVTTSANLRSITLTAAIVVLGIIAIFSPDAMRYPPLHRISIASGPFILPCLEIGGLVVIGVFLVTTDVVLGWRDILELSNVYRRRAALFFTLIPLIFVVASGWALHAPIVQIAKLLGW